VIAAEQALDEQRGAFDADWGGTNDRRAARSEAAEIRGELAARAFDHRNAPRSDQAPRHQLSGTLPSTKVERLSPPSASASVVRTPCRRGERRTSESLARQAAEAEAERAAAEEAIVEIEARATAAAAEHSHRGCPRRGIGPRARWCPTARRRRPPRRARRCCRHTARRRAGRGRLGVRVRGRRRRGIGLRRGGRRRGGTRGRSRRSPAAS
jgi:hypothetical protein